MDKGLRTYQTATGYTLAYRTLPPDFLPALRARVREQHAATMPATPTVTVETAPGQFADIPLQTDGDLPDDPDRRAIVVAYRAALAAWEQAVVSEITAEMKRVMERTVRVPIDADAVGELRAVYDMAGLPLPDDDAAVMLWHVVLTDNIDQAAVAQSLAGQDVEEAAQHARRTFRRALEGASA